MSPALIDETPLFVDVAYASRRSGLDPDLVRGWTLADPHPEVEDEPVVRWRPSRRRPGDPLVHLVDVMEMAALMEPEVEPDPFWSWEDEDGEADPLWS